MKIERNILVKWPSKENLYVWKLEKIADGNLSCDNFELDSSRIKDIEETLIKAFGKQIKQEKIFISWDCWSGIFIMLIPGCDNFESSNKVIEKIYECLISTEGNEE